MFNTMPMTQILLWNVVWFTSRVNMEPVPQYSLGPTLWLRSSTQDSLMSSGLKTCPAQKLMWLPPCPDYKGDNSWRIPLPTILWTTNQIKGDNSWSIPPTILRHEQRIRSQGTRIEALLQQVNLNSCLRVDQIHSGMECGTLDTCNLSNKNNSIFHDLFFMNI